MLLVATFVALLAADHLLASQLEPTQHMVSEYVNAGGLAGAAAVIALLCWAASWLIVAATTLATRGAMTSPRMATALAGCLAVAGVGIAVAALFATDAVEGVVPPGAATSTAGRLHDLGGGVAQLALLASAALSLLVFKGRRRFQVFTVVVLATGLLLGPVAAAADVGVPGLRQRTLVSLACVWELALIALLLPSRGPRPATGASPNRLPARALR